MINEKSTLIRRKLISLISYYEIDLEEAIERMKFWSNRVKEYGEYTPINPEVDKELTYGKMLKKVERRVKKLENNLKETYSLIDKKRDPLKGAK